MNPPERNSQTGAKAKNVRSDSEIFKALRRDQYEHRDAPPAGHGLYFAARESGVFFSERQRGNQRNTRRAVQRPGGTGDLNITVIPPRSSDYNGVTQQVHTKRNS